jgi:hypothetical protein
MSITVYGASDDLIEVEGGFSAEFNVYDDEGVLLACSDGTVLGIVYDKGGCWRITPRRMGWGVFSKVESSGPDGDDYSDRVTIEGDVVWVALTSEEKFASKPRYKEKEEAE